MYHRSMPYLDPGEVRRLPAGARSNEPRRQRSWVEVFANLTLAPGAAPRLALIL